MIAITVYTKRIGDADAPHNEYYAAIVEMKQGRRPESYDDVLRNGMFFSTPFESYDKCIAFAQKWADGLNKPLVVLGEKP